MNELTGKQSRGRAGAGLRTVQLKACDVGKESQVASLVKEAKDAMDPVTGGDWPAACGTIPVLRICFEGFPTGKMSSPQGGPFLYQELASGSFYVP